MFMQCSVVYALLRCLSDVRVLTQCLGADAIYSGDDAMFKRLSTVRVLMQLFGVDAMFEC